jgi:ribulose-phosphate 3-epimerase
MFKISASVLSADFSNLKEEIKSVSSADYIHLDVMDGHFVQNLTFGVKFIKDIRGSAKQPFDTHLMVSNPEDYVEAVADAGGNIFTFHQEAITHCDRLVQQIKENNMKAGVSIAPSTDENVLKYLMGDIDLILVMTVNPGFGGQKFLVSQLKKIENIRNMIEKSGRKIELEVDGGIDEKTIKLAKNAGANVFVAGSFIFTENREFRIKLLRDALNA